MKTKAELVTGAFSGGIETTIPECAGAFGCLQKDPIETTNELKEQLSQLGIDLIGRGEYDKPRIIRAAPRIEVKKEIQQHENSTTEFKETLLFHIKQAEHNPDLKPLQLDHEVTRHSVLKTICGFLNRNGGVLYIGVNDDGEMIGIERDFPCLGGGGDADSWQLHLSNLIKTRFKDGAQIISHVDIGMLTEENVLLCRVSVTARKEISFLVDKQKNHHLFVRSGSETNEYAIEDVPAYTRTRDAEMRE